MPIQTDLSVSPYFDDYQEDKDYYKILFQPSVPVQVRELNQLQTLLQKQVEKFGDHIFKRGTILNGCQFNFITSIPYVKIKDTTAAGTAAAPNLYEGLLAKNSSNLIATVTASNTGFESSDPDLKTLYLNYINSGDNGDLNEFANGQVLEIYNSDRRLYSITVGNASTGFSNNDTIVVLSAIEVQNTTGGTTFSNGTFQVGELITQDTTSAQAVITSVNTTANSTALTLGIKPVTGQLSIANTASWRFGTGYSFTSDTTGNEAVLQNFVGSGANASFSTTGAGAISSVTVVSGGSGYTVNPHVTISGTTATNTQINTLSLTPNAFIANVTVATVTNSTGSAYGVGVTEGTIYQKGYFLRAQEQMVIVDKYANTPDALSVGFSTTETVANSSVDTSLVDNAGGFLNVNAPGANRLKLVPTLSVKTNVEADADPEFLPLVKFSEGRPYEINNTEYDGLADELAKRTFEESGNYVLDKFHMATRSTISIANSDTHFSYVIDPGHAYINGYRIRTERDLAINVEKATQTNSFTNTVIDTVYGNYLLVNEFAGLHAFSTGSQVSLRDTAVSYISTDPDADISAAVTAASSAEIGKARVRAVMYHGGSDQGTPGAIYRIYLFDIRMNAGNNFVNVKAVFADNAGLDGIADAILEPVAAASGSASGAVLKLKDYNSLILPTNLPLSSVSSVNYQYRTTFTSKTVGTNGTFVVPADTNAEFPYAGTLTSFEENALIVLPEEDLVSTADISGVGSTLTFSNTGILQSSNGDFIADLDAGDYIKVDDTSNSAIVRVVSTANAQNLVFSPSNALDTVSEATATIVRCYPKGIPVPMSRRTQASANSNTSHLSFNLDIDMSATANVSIIANQRLKSTATATATKTADRNNFVLIDCSNNAANTVGPWCLGFSDVIRLRKVYLGSNTSGTDVTKNFYVNSNQNENFYDLSQLVLKPNSNLSITSGTQLLVEFDYTNHSSGLGNGEGIKTISSYTINDEVALANLTTDVNTLELPQFVSKNGRYYDVRECLDFRPRTANTVAPQSDYTLAPTNPALPTESTRFSGSNLYFPVPEGDLFCDLSYYLPRKDIIVLNDDGDFEVIVDDGGEPSIDNSQIVLYNSQIPPYPSLPNNLSEDVQDILNTRVDTDYRQEKFKIVTSQVFNQNPGYTMEEIGQLERRISVLEYYANISELEDEVKNSVLPSSVDSTIERFKFGFFVENFVDQDYTDYNSSQYRATVFEDCFQPAREQFNLDFKLSSAGTIESDGFTASFPSTRRTILSQPVATAGAVILPPPPKPEEPPPPPPEAPTPTIGNTSIYITNTDTKRDPSTNPQVYQETIFTLSSLSEADGRDIVFEFNFFSGKDRVEFYQSENKDTGYSLIYTNETLTPTNLTQARKVELTNLDLQPLISSSFITKYNGRWTKDPNWSYVANGGNTDYWLKNVGKLTFPYNFSGGRYLKVKVIKGTPYHSYYITFPGDVITYETEVGGASSTSTPPIRRTTFNTGVINLQLFPNNQTTLKTFQRKKPICKPAPVRPKPVVCVSPGKPKVTKPAVLPWSTPVSTPPVPVPTTVTTTPGVAPGTLTQPTLPAPEVKPLEQSVTKVVNNTGGGTGGVKGGGELSSINTGMDWKLK